jgi:hypothetical protein
MCDARRRPEGGRNVLDLNFHCLNREIVYYTIAHPVGVVLYNVRYRFHNSHPMLSTVTKKEESSPLSPDLFLPPMHATWPTYHLRLI